MPQSPLHSVVAEIGKTANHVFHRPRLKAQGGHKPETF